VLSASGGTAVVEVGGVGFALQLTPDHVLSLRVGEETFLHTSLIVREDALQLFGFADREQLEVFELLNGVSGVGPKSAIGVLSVLSPDEIAAAVAADDDAPFRKVSGIGPKTAKLIVVSLAGKLTAVRRPAPAVKASRAPSSIGDSVLVALVGLGWPERVAAEAVAEVTAETEEKERDSVQALLRLTLSRLGPAR
jgi:Holliday junction DNA helicase RuvA